MENLRITTSQNVEIEHNIASIGDRMLAHFLDYCFFFGYFLFILFIFSFSFDHYEAILIILMLPMIFYDLFFEYFFNGQSLGKMIAKIKVVRLDGAPASFGNYLLRWLFRIIDNLLISGAIAIITLIISNKGQRLGDIAAGTTIIKLSKKITLADNFLVSVPKEYTTVYPSVSVLSEQDINTIKEVLNFYKLNTYQIHNAHIAQKAKTAIENKMNIKSQQLPLAFFKTILADYYYLNS
jgi:uncharacterized RDD family membrane protein YckC